MLRIILSAYQYLLNYAMKNLNSCIILFINVLEILINKYLNRIIIIYTKLILI